MNAIHFVILKIDEINIKAVDYSSGSAYQESLLINRPHNTAGRGQICGVYAYLKPADPHTETTLGQGTLMKTIRPWIKVATGQLSVFLGTTCLMHPRGRPYSNQRIRWKFRALIPNIMPPAVNPLLVILLVDLAPYITEYWEHPISVYDLICKSINTFITKKSCILKIVRGKLRYFIFNSYNWNAETKKISN